MRNANAKFDILGENFEGITFLHQNTLKKQRETTDETRD